ncbi:hypothetical protein [Rhizobium sp. SAFR-030]|uniref:hypothetical protein n=1 Tax=Rhizobium sp. SAFR-030 TaxID=3387277 RepID=UPI003F808A28
MHRTGLGFAPLLFAALLSACNTTDALTPQVDVGGGLYPSSSQVSQADARRLAEAPEPDGDTGYYPSAPPRAGRPQNSLQAQSQAIEEGGRSGVASAPLDPPPSSRQRATSLEDEAEPQAPSRSPPLSPAAAEPPADSEPSAREASVETAPTETAPTDTAKAEGATIRFLPIIGAPVQAVTPLSRQLGASARAGGLTIRPSADTSSEHILKGYLSAFDNEGKVTVVYVWDVLDPAGGRLHRIQGQETVPASGGDPWAAVPAETMQLVGQKTIGEYLQWRNTTAR